MLERILGLLERELVVLLRVAWVGGILPLLIASIPSSRVLPVHRAMLGFCGRGKTADPSSISLTVPQKYFTHFYVVAVVWTSLLILTAWSYAREMPALVSGSFYSDGIGGSTIGSQSYSIQEPYSNSVDYSYLVFKSVFLLLLMEVQALRRLYESVHVFRYNNSARMHILAYFTAGPLSLCCKSVPQLSTFAANQAAKFLNEGKNQLQSREFGLWDYLPLLTELGWSQRIGAAIFFWGSIHQWRCHAILGKLRQGKEHADNYAIPYGDWFDMVSSPHYLAEIVIYAGILVASGGTDLTVWLLFVFVVANLSFAAAATHRWYRGKFDDYPRNRYAIIPYSSELVVDSGMAAAYGTAKSGVGVASMGVMRPEVVMKSIVPVVMTGVLGIYGLIIAVIISTGINPKAKGYYLFDGYAHFSSGIACGLAGLGA
ncbi:Polyprenol reductase 2-like protein, partial [Drosera capensis]